jgi:hypothetical protein
MVAASLFELAAVASRITWHPRPDVEITAVGNSLMAFAAKLGIRHQQPHNHGANIIARCIHDVQADRVSNYECDRFHFELRRVARTRTGVAVVQQFVREFVCEHHEP